MNKRLIGECKEFIYKGQKTPFSPGTLAIVIFCTVLLIVATFTKLEVSHYWWAYLDGEWSLAVKKYPLVPQIPVVMFTAALLGPGYGCLAMFFYLLSGVFVWPVFGFGGGLEYLKDSFFGFILGFFAANIFAGRILSSKYNAINILKAAIIGVLAIHISGILYSSVLSFFSKTPPYNFETVPVLTQIAYGIVFSVITFVIAKPVKYILWIAMKNETRTKK